MCNLNVKNDGETLIIFCFNCDGEFDYADRQYVNGEQVCEGCYNSALDEFDFWKTGGRNHYA